jgi:hypothetical protein
VPRSQSSIFRYPYSRRAALTKQDGIEPTPECSCLSQVNRCLKKPSFNTRRNAEFHISASCQRDVELRAALSKSLMPSKELSENIQVCPALTYGAMSPRAHGRSTQKLDAVPD